VSIYSWKLDFVLQVRLILYICFIDSLFIKCFDDCWLGDRKDIQHVKILLWQSPKTGALPLVDLAQPWVTAENGCLHKTESSSENSGEIELI